MREEIKNWFKLAKRDLDTSKHNLENKDYYAYSFFAQQAVEKGLKALQLKKEKKITKTHDLLLLAKKLEIPKDIIEKCDKLNPIYIETRYPDSNGKFEDYSKEESEEDIKLAEEALLWIEKKNIIEKLKIFKSKLNNEFPIKKMIFFGSRAKGKAHRYSDIDLIIVSKKFRRKKFRYRPLGFYNYWDLDYPVDFLCYTPEEFNKLKKQITIVREAVKEGIAI